MGTVDKIDIGIDTATLTPGTKFFVGVSPREYQNKGTANISSNIAREAEDNPDIVGGSWAEGTSQNTGNNKFFTNTSGNAGDYTQYTYHIPTDGEWYLAFRMNADQTSDVDVDVAGNVTSAINLPLDNWAATQYILIGPFDLTEGDITVKFTVNTNTIVEFDRFTMVPYRIAAGLLADEHWFPRDISHEALKRITRRGVVINI